VTRKELFDGGWIDRYVLGLTDESESREVERLAGLYPDIQEELNQARGRLCSSFNRRLTRPALRQAFLSRKNLRLAFGLVVAASMLVIGVTLWQHLDLRRTYKAQCASLEQERARSQALADRHRTADQLAQFVNAENTERIQLRGCEESPEAEVVVYRCLLSGKMMMRVIELPAIEDGRHLEVWARGNGPERLVGKLFPPIRYDSLYVLDTALHSQALAITSVDPVRRLAEPLCLATIAGH